MLDADNIVVQSIFDFESSSVSLQTKHDTVTHRRLNAGPPSTTLDNYRSQGPGAVVKAVCLESRRSRVQTPLWPPSFTERKMFLPRSLVKIQYCGEAP